MTCHHASLVLIVSVEADITTKDFGWMNRFNTIEGICQEVMSFIDLRSSQIEDMSGGVWEFARGNYIRKRFALAYERFVLIFSRTRV